MWFNKNIFQTPLFHIPPIAFPTLVSCPSPTVMNAASQTIPFSDACVSDDSITSPIHARCCRLQDTPVFTGTFLQWRHNARRHLKSPALRLFTQPFIRVQIKENIKAPRHWPLCREFPAQMASNAENVSIWCLQIWPQKERIYE